MNTASQTTAPVREQQHAAFGGIPLIANKRIDLLNGLPGFEDLHRFVLAELDGYAPFSALQSEDRPEISMLVIDAKLLPVWEDIQIPARELQILDLEDSSLAEQYVILKVDQNSQEFTANIKAPIVFNPRSGAANQVILDNAKLSVEHPLNKELI
jgi:flagellar assembly factor FliW